MTDADMKKVEHGQAAVKREYNGRGSLHAVGPAKSHQEITYVDVAVIGNGPSGICLSYLLSGHWPYYSGLAHPNEYLHKRLQVEKDKPLILQDLKFLSDDLEGRSPNPVSLLFDTLSNPDADLGREAASLLQWKLHPDKEISHVVLGKKEEGGIWQMMEGEMRTLSLSNWMQLPDSSFDKWLQDNRRSDDPDKFSNRARMEEVRRYYFDYVQEKNLKKYFSNHSTVTSVQRIRQYVQTADDESGEDCASCDARSTSQQTSLWLVLGHRVIYDSNGQPERQEDFCYETPNLVLATGSFDQPNTLRVKGEDLPYICHSLPELEQCIRSERLGSESHPVVVVGAGLSAADAILHLLSLSVPVIHILRRDADNPQIIYRQLPPKLYPEYHTVYRLMQGKDKDDRYKSYSVMDIVEFTEDRQVLLRSRQTGQEMMLQASCVVVLIGSRPDLSFMPTNILRNLGVVPGVGIHSPHNPVDVDPYTYQSNRYPGLYAMGPLVGDGFVRFLRGGALGIVSHLWQKQET